MEGGSFFSFILLSILVTLVVVIIFVIEENEPNQTVKWISSGGGDSKLTNYDDLKWSYDGINWKNSLDTGDQFKKIAAQTIAYGKDLWIVGGRNPDSLENIMTSNDGKKWKVVTRGSSIKKTVEGIAFGKNEDNEDLWVAVGDNDVTEGGQELGNIMWSSTGTCWVSVTEGDSFSTFGNKVAFGKDEEGNNLWVATGDNTSQGGDELGNIMWSTTGTCWVSVTEGDSFSFQGEAVAFGKDHKDNNLWVAVGNNTTAGGDELGNIMWSTTGTCWVSVTDGDSFKISGKAVAYGKDEEGNNLWVAVGDNYVQGGGSETGNIMWSSTGTCWVATTHGEKFPTIGLGVFYNDGLWVATGGNNTPGEDKNRSILTSINGKIWRNNAKGPNMFDVTGEAVSSKI